MLKMGRKADGSKYVEEELTGISLDEIKKMIEVEMPGAFDKANKKAPAKKAATKKTPAKKAAPKKGAAGKTAKKSSPGKK
jgi:DNA topoisomerase-1